MKLRLIPVLLAAAVLLLGLKVSDVWEVVRAQTVGQAMPAAPAPDPGAPTAATEMESEPAQSPLSAGGKSSAVPAADPLMMSPSEIEVLQKLSERRAALDRRAQEMSQQEVVLKAAEQRVDEKLAKLQSMEKEIGGQLDKET